MLEELGVNLGQTSFRSNYFEEVPPATLGETCTVFRRNFGPLVLGQRHLQDVQYEPLSCSLSIIPANPEGVKTIGDAPPQKKVLAYSLPVFTKLKTGYLLGGPAQLKNSFFQCSV